MTLEEKLQLFEGMLQGDDTVYVWQYDAQGNLLKSNCPDEAALGAMFQVFGCKEKLFLHAEVTRRPMVLGSFLGESWFADFYRENGEIETAVVIGPFFGGSMTVSRLDMILKRSGADQSIVMSQTFRKELVRALERAPYITPVLTNRYALMLHYFLTGEQKTFSDLFYVNDPVFVPQKRAPEKQARHDREKVWIYEQGLMRMVREGDLNFRQAVQNSSSVSAGVGITGREPLRQVKNSVIIYISLCVRAAIEGGLSPEVAYSLGDSYIQSVEDAATEQEIAAISNSMYPDFIQRVHKCRTNPQYSKPIQIACDYIEQNAEGDLSMAAIASRVGYAEYYLSRKFKEEVHTSINDYIKIVKVERAKFLLGCTQDSVQDISEKLHFCSRSYFGETFRKITGVSPVEYRENYRRG